MPSLSDNQPLLSSPDDEPAIAAAVIVADRRVLLVRRRISEGILTWQFPAGEVEPGETYEQAAIRETAEEVGLTVAAKAILGQRRHPYTGRTMVYVACDVITGTARVVDPNELAEVDWVDRARLDEYVAYPLFAPMQDYLATSIA